MAETGISRSGLSREERRARTQKKIRLGALQRQKQAISRAKLSPFSSPASVAQAQKRYDAEVAKWKKRRPEWWN